MSELKQVTKVIEDIGTGFEEFKKVNNERIEELGKGNEARAAELAEKLEKIEAKLSKDTEKKEQLDKEIAAASERLELLESLNDRPKSSAADKLSSEHKDLFEQWVRSGGHDDDAREKAQELHRKSLEVKDVNIGTNADGGFAVPEEIAAGIDKILLKTSSIVQHVKNVRASTSDYKELVSVNDAGYAWAGETTDRSANTDTPELRERVPTFGELYAHPRATKWSLQDVGFNVQNWIIDNVAEAHSVGLSSAIWNGNGTNKPSGFINTTPATTADGNEASPQRDASALQYQAIGANASPFAAAGFDADDLINLVYAVNPRIRAMGNCRFAMNTTTQGFVRKLKDGNGNYIWQPSLQAGQPDMLLGYSSFTWEEMGNPTTANAFPVAFGDFNKGYSLVTRSGLNMLVDPYTAKGYVGFFIDRRYGGVVTNNSAVKLLKVALT